MQPRFQVWLFAVLTIFALSACSPEYNWREVRPADSGYQVLFPAKPASAERNIRLDGLEVRMRMQAAQAGGQTFAAGVVDLPGDNDDLRERALAAMRAQMPRNIGASDTQSTPLSIAVMKPSGAALSHVEGQQIAAKGPGRPNTLFGGFVARQSRAYQWVVIGNDPDPEVVRTFIDSFRLTE